MTQVDLDPSITFSTYMDVQVAFGKRALARSTNYEGFERGNILEGVVMLLHGGEHRKRRSRENPLFSMSNLQYYEREVFPSIVASAVGSALHGGEVDAVELSGLITVFMSASIAGIDLEPGSIEQARRLVELDHIFNTGVGIEDYLDDLDELKRQVREALDEFVEEFYAASLARRQRLLDRGELGDPNDLLSALLLYQDELGIDDDTVLRETAFFLESGSHTTAQTLANTLHQLFHHWLLDRPEDREKLKTDTLFAQRCVQEALRLRPILPKVRRRVVEDVEIRGHRLRQGDLVELDIVEANRDEEVFGPDAAEFNPYRGLPAHGSLVGHSFSAGMHSCIGRTLATGLPLSAQRSGDDEKGHLVGMAPHILKEYFRADIAPAPSRQPTPIAGSRRWTRWDRYPVVFGAKVPVA